MESRERVKMRQFFIISIFFLLSRGIGAQLYSTVEDGSKTTYTFYPEKGSPVVVQSEPPLQQQARHLPPPAPPAVNTFQNQMTSSASGQMDLDLNAITSLFKSPPSQPHPPPQLSLRLVEASRQSSTMSHRSGGAGSGEQGHPMIISSSVLYPNSARSQSGYAHAPASSSSLASVVAPFQDGGYQQHPGGYLESPPTPQVSHTHNQAFLPTPSIGTSLKSLYASTMAHSNNQHQIHQHQHQQLGQQPEQPRGEEGVASESHPIFLTASSFADMMNSATNSLRQQYPTPLNMFSNPTPIVGGSGVDLQSSGSESGEALSQRGPWMSASSIRASVRPRSGWKSSSSGWKPGSGLSSSYSSSYGPIGGHVKHLPTIIHDSEDSYSEGGGYSVSHSQVSSDPFSGWGASHKGWAAAQPLIKYVKESLPSIGWLSPYPKGGESPLRIFSTVGKTLDATLGGAWAARRAVKRGFGAVLSSKVRLGGTLAYVGSELLAKSIDVAANI